MASLSAATPHPPHTLLFHVTLLRSLHPQHSSSSHSSRTCDRCPLSYQPSTASSRKPFLRRLISSSTNPTSESCQPVKQSIQCVRLLSPIPPFLLMITTTTSSFFSCPEMLVPRRETRGKSTGSAVVPCIWSSSTRKEHTYTNYTLHLHLLFHLFRSTVCHLDRHRASPETDQFQLDS